MKHDNLGRPRLDDDALNIQLPHLVMRMMMFVPAMVMMIAMGVLMVVAIRLFAPAVRVGMVLVVHFILRI
ncbi:hypothetical protein [Bradyrhizobium diazoefficiens]